MCSMCEGERVDGCIEHRPGCDFYRPRDMFDRHPDLIDLDANVDYWYRDEDAA